jgi:hypothetical protein
VRTEKRGKAKALGILAAKLARAVYRLVQRPAGLGTI